MILQPAPRRRLAALLAITGIAAVASAPTAAAQTASCRDQSRAAYADGSGHDHFSIAQHAASCGLEQASFMSLRKELAARPDVVTGEMDIENGLAAVAVAFPESGFLLFDVRDPARPRFLSWARSKACEGLAIDVDCGAYVDLSEDGKVAFVSTQQITVVPNTPDPGAPAPAIPGVEVFDVSDPAAPRLTQTQPVASAGGVHTANSTVIPDGPNPGEYLFATANSFGIEVQRVERTGVPKVVPVARIDIPEVHDMFLQRDPMTGKTLMYVAAGFTSGFYVYDVTDPTDARLLAEWDLTPQCSDDWYSHTIDVTTVGQRRILTMPAEVFDNGASSNQACGKVAGNGDKPAPLWFVDVTDFAGLGQPGDSDEVLRRKSEATLLATWTNAADRPAGNARFSAHNQQIVGDRVYLSGYHSGVTALDASAVFRGERVRPQEVGFALPSDPTDPRPLFKPAVPPAMPFISGFLSGRPNVWDTLFYKGYLIVPDMVGGLTTYLPAARGAGGVAPTPGTEQPSQSGGASGAACVGREGFRSVAARPAGRGLALSFERRVARPVDVDVFRVSAGRRVSGERLVARFRNAASPLRWNGRPTVRGRRIAAGFYFVRYRMRLESGRLDTRRVAVLRRSGRFTVRPAFYRRAECGLLRSSKLERPAFGGVARRPLRVAYLLRSRATVTVTVTRGGRVVRRFRARTRAAGRTFRIAISPRGLRRGDYRVTIEARAGATRERSQLVARRV